MQCRVQDTRKMFYPDLFSFVWRRHVGVSLRGTNMAAGKRQKLLNTKNTALFPLPSHTGKNIKCKPCTESPEYEKWKTIIIQIASPKIRCVQCHMRDTRENVLSKFIKLCTETPCWCPFEGHKYGGRKATETSAFEFSYKAWIHRFRNLWRLK